MTPPVQARYRCLGDRSPSEGARIQLSCHHCVVTWGGCAAEADCPECGAPKDYLGDGRCLCGCADAGVPVQPPVDNLTEEDVAAYEEEWARRYPGEPSPAEMAQRVAGSAQPPTAPPSGVTSPAPTYLMEGGPLDGRSLAIRQQPREFVVTKDLLRDLGVKARPVGMPADTPVGRYALSAPYDKMGRRTYLWMGWS